MSKSGKLIEQKVKAFATGMQKRMETLRKSRVDEIDKRLAAEAKKAEKGKAAAKGGTDTITKAKAGAKDKPPTGDDLVMKLIFAMSTAKETVKRNGKQQALEVAQGDSETCAGSHMSDSARHINMWSTGPGKAGKKYYIDPKDAFGTDDKHICTFAKFQSEWADEMKKHDLRNFKGEKGYGDGDDYHLELPESRIPKDDPECKICVDEYCRLVVMEGYKNNTDFEKVAYWKNAIKAPMEKYLKQKEKEEQAARLAELKKMRFSGTLTAKTTFFSNAKKSVKKGLVAKGDMLPPKEIVAEAGKAVPIVFPVVGVPKKGTFTDVFVMGILQLTCVTYENLSQTFIKEAKLDCTLTMKGVLSYAATATASGAIDIKLGNGLDPEGTAEIEYSVDGLGPDDHSGKIVWAVKGLKTRVSSAT